MSGLNHNATELDRARAQAVIALRRLDRLTKALVLPEADGWLYRTRVNDALAGVRSLKGCEFYVKADKADAAKGGAA